MHHGYLVMFILFGVRIPVVTCVILIFVFGTPGVASLLAMLPYGYYWKHRIDMQRIRMGFPTSNSARAQEVITNKFSQFAQRSYEILIDEKELGSVIDLRFEKGMGGT